ncbi:MAG: hypothetical protein K5773_00605 [Pseudobutyrivibrio sp.]|nr:hypothetical protein [Pseudobutyrivibrio sp.]
METEPTVIGIDISAKCSVISLYKLNMNEPATVSTVLGQENYAIPTVLAKKPDIGQWYFGDEAIKKSRTREAVLVEDLYNLALRNESVYVDGQEYLARDLMVIYFKKLFSIPGPMAAISSVAKLAISVTNISFETMEMMNYIASKLDIEPDNLILMDRQESFYYYSLSQRPDLFLYDVALFDYTGPNLVSMMLSRNTNTRPQMINIDVANHGEIFDDRDSRFENIAKETFGSAVVSSVYLVGDGFDGDWMKTSLSYLCKGRKVFLGKNLYSKGACYGAFIKEGKRDWPFIYIGDNDLKVNLSIKILDNNEMKFFSLIDAGESWYDTKGECEVILDGKAEIEFYVQRPESREAHIELLELTDLPYNRENRTTRLRIEATAISDKSITITITDLGFGEISPSSGLTWNHTITVSN